MDSPRRQQSAAAERNKQPILDALRRLLPPRGALLEIASGTGQHAVHFAAGLPGWTWQPSDPDAGALASIAAESAAARLANLHAPLPLDVMAESWPVEAPVDAVFCANMIHIAPWPACAALMRGAARHLAPSGVLLTYGPYLTDNPPSAPGNLAFDADLRARNPAWGVRRLGDVVAQAQSAGLNLREHVALPANNLLLVFKRRGDAATPRG